VQGKKYTAEQIVAKLREAEVLLAKGMTLAEVCRQLEITDATYYRWRKEYSGLRVDQAKRLKELENSRLKKAVADLTLDNMILKEVSRETFDSGEATPGRNLSERTDVGVRTSSLTEGAPARRLLRPGSTERASAVRQGTHLR
jgi:putative transposase